MDILIIFVYEGISCVKSISFSRRPGRVKVNVKEKTPD